MKEETIARLKRFLEHAPPLEIRGTQLAGFEVEDVKVCVNCSTRILDRGCSLGDNPEPIWDGPVDCDVCGATYSKERTPREGESNVC